VSIQPFGSSGRRRRAGSQRVLRHSTTQVIEQLEARTLLTTVLSPTADTFIRNNAYATTNFGASPLLYAENASVGDSRVALMSFDLSSISTITSATLQAEGSLAAPDSPAVTIDAYAFNSAGWTEGTGTIDSRNGNGVTTNANPTGPITWNNAAGVTTNVIAANPVSVNRYGMQSYSWDLTGYLQSLPAGTTSVTIALEGVTATANWAQFLSRESGNFGPQLVINGTGPSAPVATPSAADITDTNSAAATFPVSVTYNSDAPIDTSTIAVGNISVTGPAGTLQVLDASFSQGGDGNSINAMYDVAAPTGGWVNTDNGIYTVTVAGGQVTASGQGAAATAESQFQVAVNDSVAPTLAITAPNVTASGGTSYQFTVTATDNVAVDPSWVDVDNVQVLAPGGQPLTVISATADSSTPAASHTFTYTVAAPAGGWSLSNNGVYTVNVLGDQLRDTAGNGAAAATATFTVAIPTPDTTPPTAIVSAPAITTPGGTNESVTVTYTDNVAINLASIAAGNITVAGPGGNLQVTGVQVSASSNGSPITAIYTVAAPGGMWEPADNGVYTVNVVAGGVKDTSSNGVVSATGTFSVTATLPDTTPPSAQITAANITTAGAAAETITIVYTDNVAVKASTISASNISVTGPSGPLTVMSAQTSDGDGSPVLVTYTVAAPHGTWSSADNGSYTIALNANQVSDLAGNFANGVLGSFSVNIPTPVDTGPSDTSFNNGQAVTAPFVTQAMVTQPDGKIIAVGREGDLTAGTSRGVIERFNADGTVDASFGSHGMIVSAAGVNEAYYAVAMAKDGTHFIVAGATDGDFLLTQFDLTGTLDTTFGSSGRTVTDFGATDAARSIAVTAADQIVVGGDSGNNFAFARFDSSGNLDPTFAQNGRQLFALGNGTTNGLGAIAIQSSGALIATGAMGSQVVVVRLTPTGEADGTFGNGGLVIVGGLIARTDLGGPDRTEGLALQSTGAILVANTTSTGDFGIVRLTANGNMDTTFGNNGIVTANFGGDDDADSIIVQSTGQIIVIGTSLTASAANTAVAAYDANGNPLTAFGTNGLLTLPSGVTLAPTTASTGSVSPQALHVGDIILQAFGTVTADGRVIIGTSNEAVAATTSSTLRRLVVPGAITTAPSSAEVKIGSFGIVNGKIQKFVYKGITFSMTGGTGTVYADGDRYSLVIDQIGKGISITITAVHGARVSLQDVTISGTLKSFTATTGDIYGTFTSTGAMGTLRLGDISGTLSSGAAIASLTARNVAGTVYATAALGTIHVKQLTGTLDSGQGVVGNVYAMSLDNARILSGVNLGADVQLGGAGLAADTYNPGSIKGLFVTKSITSSFIGAGVNPVDNTFGNNDDVRASGGGADSILQIHAHSVDQATRFEAGVFGKVLIPKLVKPASDARFTVLSAPVG